MIKKFKIVILFILMIYPSASFIHSKDLLIPQKLIFLKPEIDKTDKLKRQITEDTITVFEKLDTESKIMFLKENNWIKYKPLLSDFNKHESLSKFFIQTSVTGITSVSFEDHLDKLTIKFYFFDIKENIIKIYSYDLLKASIVEDSASYLSYIEKIIIETFRPLDIKDMRKERIKKILLNRKDPYMEFMISGGTGYISRQAINADIYSHGISFYFNMNLKIRNFSFEIKADASALFNQTFGNENLFSLYNAMIYLNLGGWFARQTFKFGAGVMANPCSYYAAFLIDPDIFDEKDNIKIVTLHNISMFFYLTFSFLPVKVFYINFKIGSFLSLNQSNNIFPFPYFPLFLELNLKYFFYKNLYFEFIVPFYIIGSYDLHSNDDNPGYSPSFQAFIRLGLGWRFEKEKK